MYNATYSYTDKLAVARVGDHYVQVAVIVTFCLGASSGTGLSAYSRRLYVGMLRMKEEIEIA